MGPRRHGTVASTVPSSGGDGARDVVERTVEAYERLRGALRDEPMPFGWLDLDAFDRNVAQTVERSGDKHLRPASKSVRCVAALRRVLAAGPSLRGLLCFAAREAALLHAEGFDDLLVAYPTVVPADLDAAMERQAEHGALLTLMVDDPTQVDVIARRARAHGINQPVCLDLDVSVDVPGVRFGVYRSPVRDAAAAAALARVVAATDGVELVGLMGYEAQVAGVPDDGNDPQAVAIRTLKRRSIPVVAERRAAAVAAVEEVVGPLRFVNGGGTGSLGSTTREQAVTEVTAGSAFYAPALFDGHRALDLAPAAGFACAITRRPTGDVVTALGGGWTSSGAAGPQTLPQPYLPPGLELLANEGAGEVQTPLRRGKGAPQLWLGDPVFFRHAKAGELCERVDALVVVQGDRVVDRWPTYRGLGWTLL